MENTGKKLKFSIGEVTYGSTTGVYRNIAVDGREVATFCNEDDSTLFADALTTVQKCGLMPSELMQQRDELLELLAHMRPIYKEDSDLFYKYENKKDELIYKNKRT